MPIDFRRDAPASSSAASPVAPPWTPASLSGLELWLDADDASTITKSASTTDAGSEEVSAWNDKAGSGAWVEQATPANMPQWRGGDAAYQINGKPAVKYITASQRLASSGFNLGTAAADHSTPISVFSVGQLDLPPTGTDFFVFDGANTNTEQFFGRWLRFTNITFQSNTRNIDEGDGAGIEANATQALNPGANPWLINVENNRQGNQSFIRYNGTNVDPQNCAFGEEGFDGLVVGGNLQGTKSLCGRMGEFLIISGTLPQADRERVEGYLAHRWGLTGNLPLNHPYKVIAP